MRRWYLCTTLYENISNEKLLNIIKKDLEVLFDKVERENDNLGEPCGCFTDKGEDFYCEFHILKKTILGGK